MILKLFKREGRDLVWRVGWRARLVKLSAVAVSAAMMAAALPPLNWTGLIWIGMVPALAVFLTSRPLAGGFYSWLWASIFGCAGYFWLREIHPAVPWLIGPIYGLYYLPLGWLAGIWRRAFLVPLATQLAGCDAERQAPPPAWWREILLTLAIAALFVVLEYLRWHILPWNYLSATQWRNQGLIGIAAYTGTYGISFLIVLVNAALALTLLGAWRCGRGYRRAWALGTAILALMAAFALSIFTVAAPQPGPFRSFKIGVIQPNPPQRRLDLSTSQVRLQDAEALAANLALSRQVAGENPLLIVWPETSISAMFRAGDTFSRGYLGQVRGLLNEVRVPLLLGTLDLEELPGGVTRRPGYTNTVWMLGVNDDGSILSMDRYDKQHLVPFGEYVPFRRWIPSFFSEYISMGEDLTPGTRMEPFDIPPGFKAGINICFEDIFPYIARRQVQLGADFLVVGTNDSWYPESAEQEQHLANSVFRAVETGVPMVRCGSNSGSVLIRPDGSIEPLAGLAPTERGRAAGCFTVTVPTEYRPTWFVRFGEWWVRLCELGTFAALLYAFVIWRRRTRRLIAVTRSEETL